MPWSDINDNAERMGKAKDAQEEARIKSINLARAFSKAFESDQGKIVLEHLVQRFIYNNETAINSQNINYEAAYHNGESGVIKYIINQMTRAKND